MLSAGEPVGPWPTLAVQAYLHHHYVRVLTVREVAGEMVDGLLHGEVVKVAGGLQHDPESAAPESGRVLRVGAEVADLAGVTVPVALEDLGERRLARTIGAEQCHALSFGDLE